MAGKGVFFPPVIKKSFRTAFEEALIEIGTVQDDGDLARQELFLPYYASVLFNTTIKILQKRREVLKNMQTPSFWRPNRLCLFGCE